MKEEIKFVLDGKEVVGKILDIISHSYYDRYNVLIINRVYIVYVYNKIIKLNSEILYDECTNESYETFYETMVLFEYE